MFLTAIALSFFGMFIMFFSIARGQDKLLRFVNKKHKEFAEEILKIEKAVATMVQVSGKARPSQAVSENYYSEAPQNALSFTDKTSSAQKAKAMGKGVPAQKASPASVDSAQRTNAAPPKSRPSSNVDQVMLDDVFPSDAAALTPSPKRSTEEPMHLEDVFTLQPDTAGSDDQVGKRARDGKSSMLELLQL